MKRAVRILLIIFTLILLLFTALLVAASYIFDSKIEEAIRLVNNRQHYVFLRYKPQSSTLLNKKGRLELTIADKNDPTKVDFDVDISFFYSEVSADFKKINGSGNLDRKLSNAGLPIIDLKGRVAFYPMLAKLSMTAKSSAADILLNDGKCRLGENQIKAFAHSKNSLSVSLSSAGIKCKGSSVYDGRPSYEVNLLDFIIDLKPVINKDKSISLDDMSVSLASLDAQASTLYLIGFSPDEEVTDRTLRDGFSLKNLKVNLKESKDSNGLSKIDTKGQMDLKFAFPLVKKSIEQKPFDLSDLRYDLSIDSLDLRKLKKFASSGEIETLFSALSSPFNIRVNSLSFIHREVASNLSGQSAVRLVGNSLKQSRISASYKLDVAKTLIEDLTQNQYKENLAQLSKAGAVDDKGDTYSTLLEFDGKELSLNSISLSDNLAADEEFSDDSGFSDEPDVSGLTEDSIQ